MEKTILETPVELTIHHGVLHLNAKNGCLLRISGLDPTLSLEYEADVDIVMRWQAGE